jgi:hypothetical protein
MSGCSDDGAGNGGSATSAANTEADSQAFCEKARSLDDAIVIDPQSPDPAEVTRAADGLEELSRLAPDEIRSQVASSAQLLGEFSDLLASVDPSNPTAMSDPDFQERLASLQERESSQGSDLDEVATFIEAECELDGGQDGTGSGMDDSTS